MPFELDLELQQVGTLAESILPALRAIQRHDGRQKIVRRLKVRVGPLFEIVSQAGADKLPARERFKFYRERGYELHNQDISTGF